MRSGTEIELADIRNFGLGSIAGGWQSRGKCSPICSVSFGGQAQFLSPFGRIDAEIRKLSRGVISCPGVFHRDVR